MAALGIAEISQGREFWQQVKIVYLVNEQMKSFYGHLTTNPKD